MTEQEMHKLLEKMEVPRPQASGHQHLLEKALLESGYIGRKAGFFERLKHMRLNSLLLAGTTALAVAVIAVAGINTLPGTQNTNPTLLDDSRQDGTQEPVTNDDQEPIKKYGYFEVPELGIRFKVPEQLEGQLVYDINEYGTGAQKLKAASFSTSALIKAAKDNPSEYPSSCSASDSPLGAINVTSKLVSVPAEWPEQKGDIDGYRWVDLGDLRKDDPYLISYQDGYIRYVGPQSTCSANAEVAELQSRQVQLLQEAFATVELIEKTQ